MFHVYGLAICTITSLAKGMTVVVLPKFDFVNMLDACQTYKVTNLPLVPPIIIALTKLDVVLKYDLSALVQIGSGAAPLGRDILIECAKRFPKIDFKQVLLCLSGHSCQSLFSVDYESFLSVADAVCSKWWKLISPVHNHVANLDFVDYSHKIDSALRHCHGRVSIRAVLACLLNQAGRNFFVGTG